MSRHKVLCHDREWPQQGLCCRERVGSWQGVPRSRQDSLCLDRRSSRLKSSMLRHTVLCCDKGWSL